VVSTPCVEFDPEADHVAVRAPLDAALGNDLSRFDLEKATTVYSELVESLAPEQAGPDFDKTAPQADPDCKICRGSGRADWAHLAICPCDCLDPPVPQKGSSTQSAPELLTKAADLMAERGKQYDASGSERSMGKAVRAFNAITGHELSEPQGWLLLQVLKDVRLFTKPGYHQDSAEDCIAYAALKAEAKQSETDAG
jgi:hypothetical protein